MACILSFSFPLIKTRVRKIISVYKQIINLLLKKNGIKNITKKNEKKENDSEERFFCSGQVHKA